MKVAIVVIEALTVAHVYDAPEPQQGNWGGEWGSSQVTVHLEVPEGLDPQCLMAVRSESGEIILQADPQKIEDHKATLWSQLRTERNRRLAASDWTQLPDARVDKDAWVEYRQKLRDLPGETQDPLVIEWPTTPTN